jgi:hypothetical protein
MIKEPVEMRFKTTLVSEINKALRREWGAIGQGPRASRR